MKEKVSSKESGEGSIPRVDPDAPGLPAGEELLIDPVSGDEIDPIRKWWDEAEETSREKARNRRLEELEAEAEAGAEKVPDAKERDLARRRKKTDPSTVPVLTLPKETVPPTTPDISPVVIKDEDDDPKLDEDEDGGVLDSDVFPVSEGESHPPETREGEAASAENDESSVEPSAIEAKVDLENLFKPVAASDPSARFLEFPDFEGEADPSVENDVSAAAETEEELPLLSIEAALEMAPSDPTAEAEIQNDPVAELPTENEPVGLPEDIVEEGEPIEEPVKGESVPAEKKEIVILEDESTDEKESQPEDLISAAGENQPDLPQENADGGGGGLPTRSVDGEVVSAPEPVPGATAVAQSEFRPVRKKAGWWTIFATLFFFVSLLLIAAIGVVGWFAWSRLGDAENEIATRVRSGLEERGIYFDYGSGRYQFPRGLVFDEVTIFDDATRQRPLIKMDGLGVNVDLVGFVRDRGEFRSGGFTLQDSTVTLFEAGESVGMLEGVVGEILTGPDSLRVERLSAMFGGWQIHLNGLVSLPPTGGQEVSAADISEKPVPAPLKLDFSAYKKLEPWLSVGSRGEDAPVLDLTFSMDATQPDLASIEGRLHARDLTWEGVDFSSASATFHLVPETGDWKVSGFQIGYGEGFIGGRLTVDTAAQRLRVEQVQSTVDVLALLGQWKPEWAATWKSFRLIDLPSLQITGEVPWGDPAAADLTVRYAHREGLVVALEKGELPLSDLRGKFTVNRGSVETNDAGFELFGGQVRINGAMRLTDEARPFNGLLEITDLSLDKATSFFGKKDTGMSGRLSFVFRGVGYREVEKMRGGGTLRIEEAIIPDLPILGEIQDYVGRAVPAFGVRGQGNITGAYIVESGVLVASDLTVGNSATRIVTSGSINLSSLETSFTTKAELVPSLAAATGLTDKVITFEGQGPLGDTVIAIKKFPLEFASVSLGSILGTSPRSLGTLKIVPGVETAIEAFADQLDEPGITIHPEVTGFFKSLLGEEVAPPAAPEAPVAPPQE